jgi:hypothetical protein
MRLGLIQMVAAPYVEKAAQTYNMTYMFRVAKSEPRM